MKTIEQKIEQSKIDAEEEEIAVRLMCAEVYSRGQSYHPAFVEFANQMSKYLGPHPMHLAAGWRFGSI